MNRPLWVAAHMDRTGRMVLEKHTDRGVERLHLTLPEVQQIVRSYDRYRYRRRPRAEDQARS